MPQAFTKIIKEENKHDNNLDFMFDSSIMRNDFYHYYKYYYQIGIMNILVENWTLLLEKETFQSYVTEVEHLILFIFFIFLFTVCHLFLNLLCGLPIFLNI